MGPAREPGSGSYLRVWGSIFVVQQFKRPNIYAMNENYNTVATESICSFVIFDTKPKDTSISNNVNLVWGFVK